MLRTALRACVLLSTWLPLSVPSQAATTPPGDRPAWDTRPLPADFQGPGSVHSLGTSVVFQTPSAVYLWSAVTTRWAVVPTSPGAQVTQFNAMVLIQDGGLVHGYATRTGTVRTLSAQAAPQLHHGSSTSGWMAVAQDGDEVWGFGAFDGEWRHVDLATATPTISVSQTAALVDDGVELHAFSAYHHAPVSTPSLLGATIDTDGDVGVAWTATQAVAYSSHLNTFAVQPMSAGVNLAVQRGYAMFQDGAEWHAFSPCTGDFVTLTPPAGASLMAGRYVAAGIAGNEVLAYSSGRNVADLHTFASQPSLQVDDEVLSVQDVDGVRAFSIVTGQFSDLLPGAFTVTLGDAMVWADDGLTGHGYASVTGRWSEAPAFGPQSVPVVLRNAVVVADGQGYHAFAGRTGAWRSQATTVTQNYTAPTSGDVFAAFDGNHVHVFDPVLVRWATRTGPAPVQDHDVWRQTFVGYDGTRAVGFGLMNNHWETLPIQGTYQQLDANSSVGHVVTDTHVHTYSAHGSLTTLSRFPEFSRLQPQDAPLRLLQTAPPGSTVMTFFALRADHVPMQPLGTLFVDRGTIFTRVPMGPVPASGLLDVALDVSTQTPLHGISLYLQNLVTPPSGPAWLTNTIAPVIL